MANLSGLKIGNVIQIEYIGDDILDYMELANWQETRSEDGSWDEFIIWKVNDFCKNHDILDIEVIGSTRSNYHDGTFSKSSETYSGRPRYVIYHQIKKPDTQNGRSVNQ